MAEFTLRPEDLLEHTGSLRALARRLVRDSETAEGLVQDTWVRALEHPPRRSKGIGAWLRTILRNEARQHVRSAARRERRERAVARSEYTPSPEEMAERLAVQRTVLDAIDALSPKLRQAVFLRWFEDLPPREIASRLGVPRSTVKSRLERAITELRSSLDAMHDGNRSRWLLALTGFAWPPKTATSTLTLAALIVTAVNLKLILAAAAAVLLIAGYYLTDAMTRQPTGVVDVVRPVEPTPSVVALTPRRPTESSVDRQEVAPPKRGSAEVHSEDSLPRTGLVLRNDGVPVPGIDLLFVPSDVPRSERDVTTRSGPDGRFELHDSELNGSVRVLSSRWTALVEGVIRGGATQFGPTVIAISNPLEVRVTASDVAGPAVPGAHARLALPSGFRAQFPLPLESAETREWVAAADHDGRFAWPDTPTTLGGTLTVEANGYETQHAEVRPGTETLSVVLTPLSQLTALRGRVLDRSGAPVENARVAFGATVVRSNADGTFEAVAGGESPEDLFVVARGWQPVHAARSMQPGAEWPEWIDVQLEDPPVSIHGMVLRADGTPHPRADVWITDPTWFGVDGDVALAAENEMREHRTLWRRFETDEQGAFELPGLVARSYRIRALDRDTAQMTAVVAAEADDVTGATLQFYAGGLFEVVSGRIVDGRKQPVEGVRVDVRSLGFRHWSAKHGGMCYVCNADGSSATTDDEGRFELANVPIENVHLDLDAKGVFTVGYTFPEDRTVAEVEIVVARECPVRVDARASFGDATHAEFLDHGGEPLRVKLRSPGRVRYDRLTVMSGGRSEVVQVPDTTREVVLYQDKTELGRLRLSPNPDELVTVRG